MGSPWSRLLPGSSSNDGFCWRLDSNGIGPVKLWDIHGMTFFISFMFLMSWARYQNNLRKGVVENLPRSLAQVSQARTPRQKAQKRSSVKEQRIFRATKVERLRKEFVIMFSGFALASQWHFSVLKLNAGLALAS